MKLPVYLDYAATTPVDPRVAEKMLHYLTPNGIFGNASSIHEHGKAAKNAVEVARAQVAEIIAAEPAEIIWTSGATEANNLALKGSAKLYQNKGKHIVTLKTEHSAVLDCCQELEKQGFSVTYLAPECNGLLAMEKLIAALRDDTILVSIMHVNNETGVIQDLDTIAELTSARGILLHVDAAQTIGKIPLNLSQTKADLVSFSGHKVYGPKGIGALYIRKKPRVRVAAQMHGGGHEQGMRSGTLPVHQIVGMGEAFSLSRELDNKKIQQFKQKFWQGLADLPGVAINGDVEHAVPHIINIYFPGIKTEAIIKALPELSMSAGSACHAKGNEPSYVLRALGLSAEAAHCSLRFSFGKFTTEEEIDFAVGQIRKCLT